MDIYKGTTLSQNKKGGNNMKKQKQKIYGKEPHTATHKTYQTTDGYAFETFKEMMAHLDEVNKI